MSDNEFASGRSQLEQLRVRQLEAWQAGRPVTVEELLSEIDPTGLADDDILELVYGEVCLREESEPGNVSVAEYTERFPQYSGRIARLFEMHEAFEQGPVTNGIGQTLSEEAKDQPGEFSEHSGPIAEPTVAETASTDLRQDEQETDTGAADLPRTIGHRVSPGPADSARGDSGSRFRILRPHARGGLGEVSVAHDDELNREVALKEIQERFADDPNSRARFTLEAQVTGGLEHPGIVPVYGLGQYDDGRPYYAMRFVRGDSLEEAIERYHKSDGKMNVGQKSLELRKLLGRFIDICNALQYAHARGVLHRDLKPGNIMLGKYGETLVVDWGLAKPLGHSDKNSEEQTLLPSPGISSMPTQMGRVIGTPAYMSPEQASGRLDELGPASDVYSLGATLHSLLTGKVPFRGDVESVLRDVQEGAFPRPREINSSIAHALESICLKAMALRPSDRYLSPQHIVSELEKWLADEPVEAYREPFLTRAARWLRRHQTVASSVGAAFLVGAVSLAFGVSLLSAKNARLNIANTRVKQSNEDLREANQREKVAKNEALANAELASNRSKLTLKTLDRVIFDIQMRLQNVAGASEIRHSLLKTALQGLQEVSSNLESTAKADRYTLVAHSELGDIFMRLGSEDGLGGIGKAQKEYETSFHIARMLAEADPADTQAQRDLAISYDRLGDVHLQLGSTGEALKYYELGLSTKIQLTVTDPGDSQAPLDLSVSYLKLGALHRQLGSTADALKYYELDLKISMTRHATDPEDVQVQRALTVSYSRMGDLHRQLGSTAEAMKYYEQFLQISKKLAEADPRNTQEQRRLAIVYHRLGEMHLQIDSTPEALKYYELLLGITMKLSADDPLNAQAKRDLAVSYDSLGALHLRLGSTAEAQKYYELAHEISIKLAEADPLDAQAQRGLAFSYNRLGNLHLQFGSAEEALKYYELGLGIRTKRAEADPLDAQAQRDLTVSYNDLGNLHLQLGSTTEALKYYELGLEIRTKLAMADPLDVKAQRDLTVSYDRLGKLHLQLGAAAEALNYFEQFLEIIAKLAAADPRNAQEQRSLAISYERLGDLHLQLDSTAKALKYIELGLEIRTKLAADLSDSQAQRDLAVSHRSLGDLHLQLGSTSEALKSYGKFLEITKKLAVADPRNAQAQRDLVTSYFKLGTARLGDRKYALAMPMFEQCLALLTRMTKNGPNKPTASELAFYESRIKTCRDSDRAIHDLDFALSQPLEQAKALLLIRATALGERGQHTKVAETAEKLRELAPEDAFNLYNTACCFSYCVRAVTFAEEKDGKPIYKESEELTGKEQVLLRGYTTKAIGVLTEAVKYGWKDWARMEKDRDLDPIRKEVAFQMLMERLRKRNPISENK